MVNIPHMVPMGYVSPEYRIVHDGAVPEKMIQKRFEFDQQTIIIHMFFKLSK